MVSKRAAKKPVKQVPEKKANKPAEKTVAAPKAKDPASRKRPLPATPTIENDSTPKKPRIGELYGLEDRESGVLLTLGQGDVGQLGLGDEVLSRKKPAIVNDLADKPMKLVAAGGMHTVCLTEDNEIYSFGCNDEFALGRKSADDEDSEYEPAIVVGPFSQNKVVHITAGDSHTTALTQDGSVYVWGCFRDSHGKLGLIKQGEDCKCPTRLDSIKEPVISIASGNDHVVMVTALGKVFSFGCAEQGQLGRIARYFADRGGRRNTGIVQKLSDWSLTESDAGAEPETELESDQATLLQPRKVSLPRMRKDRSPPSRAFCGAYSSWIITQDGSVFGFGLNNYNQLGFEDTESRYVAELVPLLSATKWKQISAAQHHTLLLDDKGRVHAVGRGDYGRLGLGEDVTHTTTPTLIPNLTDITSIAANACVSFAVDKNGVGYGWGIGTNLQLTTGSEDDEWVPVKLTGRNLETRRLLQVDCGGQHTVMLACDQSEKKEANSS